MGAKYVLGSESRGLVVGDKEEGRSPGDHYVLGLGGWGSISETSTRNSVWDQ